MAKNHPATSAFFFTLAVSKAFAAVHVNLNSSMVVKSLQNIIDILGRICRHGKSRCEDLLIRAVSVAHTE